MNANHDDITRLLTEAMREEVQDTMTTTNTPEELEKFRQSLDGGRKRHHIYTAAAAAVVVAAGVTIGVAVKDSGRTTHPGQVTTPVGSGAATPTVTPSVSAPAASGPAPVVSVPPPGGQVATPSALAAGVATSKLDGPGILGVSALGSVWGVQEEQFAIKGTGHIYRLDATGKQVLSTTAYAGPDQDDLPPLQAGQAVLVPAGPAGNPDSYLAFNAEGREIGSISVTVAGQGAGGSTGGWVKSNLDAISEIDASGTTIVKTVVLPGTKVSGIAVGGGSVWVTDQISNRLLRIDPTSGTITGTAAVGVVDEFLPIAYSNGGIYVPSQDYGLRRVDAITMRITAMTSSPSDDSWLVITVAPDGDIWGEPAMGVVDDLDPVTLATKRAIQLYPTIHDGGTYGVVATSSRVYVADGDDGYVLTFPLS